MKKSLMNVLLGLFVVITLGFLVPVNASSATVDASMDNEQIQTAVNDNDEVIFEEGTYTDIAINVVGSKLFKTTGVVTFVNTDGNKFGISVNQGSNANITIDGNFTFSGYRDGMFVGNSADVTLTIAENATLKLVNGKETDDNHGTGIFVDNFSKFTINGNKNSSFIASDNEVAGINALKDVVFTANFKDMALVDMSRNKKVSGYHSGMETGTKTIITFDNVSKVTMDDNGVDAICFSSGSDTTILNIINSKDVSMKGNHSWGVNGGNIKVINSYLNISNNSDGPWANVTYTASNMYAETLYVENSTIDANNCGANNGIWVENQATIINSTINANSNGKNAYGNYNSTIDKKFYAGDYAWNNGNGIAFCNGASIVNSKITANGNGGAGIAFYATNSNGLADIKISGSTLIANGNGISPNFTVVIDGEKKYDKNYNSSKYTDREGYNVGLYSGIAIGNAIVNVEDSTMILIDNKKNGVGFHQLYEGKLVIDGETIAAISTNDEELQREIKGSNSGQETIVLSGSLQGNLDNMDGEYGDKWNDTKKDDETYVGPVNNDGTKLTEFDVNKEINKILDKDSNKFTYYDPNTGNKYDYVFKYNDDSTDLTGEGNNAYLWTPASLLHYDATEGLINYLGTAGVLKYGNSKAIQRDLLLAGLGARFTQDVTIYGNCMALAEKILATAEREGYVFLGWYIADDSSLAAKYAEEGNFEELYKLLNTEFTDMTNLEIDGVPVSELTVYAKWGKKDTGKTDPEIVPPNTGVSGTKNISMLIMYLVVFGTTSLSIFLKKN